jgi:hypothetical protein
MSDDIITLLREAKELGQRYYQLTGKPLGVTAEVAEYEAFRLLGVTLAEVRNPGFDAIATRDDRVVRYQIKGRCFDHRSRRGQRVGSLSLEKEWDAALLVLLDPDFEAREIWEASRDALKPLLTDPGSKARTERGQIGVSQFKRVGTCIWRRGTEHSPA